ncbi:MAG: helix-turn-helix domain-containing protein [Lachnospiraceae bacterium]|nr:helix-turn-helix domain-containing protein [Lachnospiraceae bacterium]
MDTLGKRLLRARGNSGLTQAAVAEKLNVSSQAVSLWERDETTPDIIKLPEIATLYGVTTDWLLKGKEPDEDLVNVTKMLSDRLFDEKRMYTHVKSYAQALDMFQTLRVLPYIREKHEGQFRKGKDKVPYINHPLLLACHAMSLGMKDDNLVSAALLHDVCEDCDVPVEELPVNDETREAVRLLTKNKEVTSSSEAGLKAYYEEISKNRIASIVKLLDRCNNISGMAAAFTEKRMAQYIRETEKYIYPMMETTSNRFPEYANQIFLIKYHMTSVIEAIRHDLARSLK